MLALRIIRPLPCATTSLVIAALAVTLAPRPARACGGFFCNASQPVNQAAERIIFSAADDGTVTAVIQIQYSGPSERFAWLLPVEGSPEVKVSSNAAFQRLQAATAPQYRMNTRVEGTCAEGPLFGSIDAAAGPAQDAGAPAADAGTNVTVVDQGSVGPYDYVTLSVDPSAPDAAEAAIDWLVMNAFDVSDFGGDVLRPYLEAGMNLLAFRLTKGNQTGSIRPVMLTFGQGLAAIPIRPTAVATTPDMGVLVWFLGEHRAVPVNYRSLEINEALLNWFNPNQNYSAVVTRAANEAGGQGFVTELAGPAAPVAPTIFSSFEEEAFSTIASADWSDREGELLLMALQNLGSLDGLGDVLADTVPLPDGVTSADVLACPGCYLDWNATDIAGFEPAAFIDALRTQVVEPMTRTRALFEGAPTVTRLYTTMSADEMTVDPVFDQNPDLPNVDNVHVAERVIECSPSVFQSEAPWRVILPNGDIVYGSGFGWPISTNDPNLDANLRILRVGNRGTGDVIEDNQAATDAYLESLMPSGGFTGPGGDGGAVPASVGGGGGGCAVVPATAKGALPKIALALFVAVVLAGRRRRRG